MLWKGDGLEEDVMADAPDCKAEEFLNIFPSVLFSFIFSFF